MFRVKARIDRELLREHLEYVKTGLPGKPGCASTPTGHGPPA